MSQKKREPRTRAISLRLPTEVADQLDHVRLRDGLSRADVIVAALRDYLGVASPLDKLRQPAQL